MINKLKQYVLAFGSIIIGAFLPYVYSYADNYAKNAQIMIYVVSIILSIIGLLIIAWIEYQQRMHRVKYTVLIFVLDSKNRLLTTNNKYHRRRMIPCGIIPNKFTPTETVYHFLKNQAGLNEGDFRSIIFEQKKVLSQEEIHPIYSQIEFVTKHENHVNLHYSFIYALRIEDTQNLSADVSFMNLEQLEHEQPGKGLFSDLLVRYRYLLDELRKEN